MKGSRNKTAVMYGLGARFAGANEFGDPSHGSRVRRNCAREKRSRQSDCEKAERNRDCVRPLRQFDPDQPQCGCNEQHPRRRVPARAASGANADEDGGGEREECGALDCRIMDRPAHFMGAAECDGVRNQRCGQPQQRR